MNSDPIITPRKIQSSYIWIEKSVVNRYATLAGITSGCILAAVLQMKELLLLEECRSLVFNEILKIYRIAYAISNERDEEAVVSNSVKELITLPEIIRDGESDYREVKKIHVRDVDVNRRFSERAGKQKKGGNKKGGSSKKGAGSKNQSDQEKSKQNKKREEEEERLKKWNDDWDKKLKAQDALDEIACCSSRGLCLKPKTQSNIWIRVTQEKKVQDVQMAFMHVPVPRPKPPPLPKLVKIESMEVPAPPKTEKKKGGKKKEKGKKK